MPLSDLPASSFIQGMPTEWALFVDPLLPEVHLADRWLNLEAAPTMAEVRSLQNFASTTPLGTWKLAIFGFGDQLRLEAANALLKLLEEPPTYLKIVVCAESDHLLPTIKSRLQNVLLEGVVAGSSEKTSYQAWQNLLASYDSSIPAERVRLEQLLKLLSLNHSTVNQQVLMDGFRNH